LKRPGGLGGWVVGGLGGSETRNLIPRTRGDRSKEDMQGFVKMRDRKGRRLYVIYLRGLINRKDQGQGRSIVYVSNGILSCAMSTSFLPS